MKSLPDLDRLLATMNVGVEQFAVFEIGVGRSLTPAPAGAVLALCVMRGALELSAPGQQPRICPTGAMIVLPPGLAARLSPLGRDPEVDVAAGLVRASLGGTLGLLDRARVPVVEDFGDSALVRLSFLEMLRIGRAREPGLGGSAILGALMKTCLLMLLGRFFERPGIDHKIVSALADPRLAGVVALIIDRPAAPHTLETLANRAGVARSTFVRLFADALGQSPMEFIAKARLFRAAAMLRGGSEPVKAVAAAVGFSSRSHFSRTFRDAYGCDPTAFRQAHRQQAPVPIPRAVPNI